MGVSLVCTEGSCRFTLPSTTDTLRRVQSSQRLSYLVALIVPTAVALVFFAPMLAGAAFLSDDYLLVFFLDPETGAVQWQQIWWDFGESWFLSHAYWRPLVSLSYGINIELLGFTPISLYAVNLVLHLVVVAATAELCYRLGSREHPVLAGILGGLFVALHPVAPEPVLWIAARTTGLEVCFRMCAVVAFAAFLRSRRKATYGLVFVSSALALASKKRGKEKAAKLWKDLLVKYGETPLKARIEAAMAR